MGFHREVQAEITGLKGMTYSMQLLIGDIFC